MESKLRQDLTEEDISRIQELVDELGGLLPFNTIRDNQQPIPVNTVGLIMKLFRNLPKEFRTSTANLMFKNYGDMEGVEDYLDKLGIKLNEE